MKNLLILLLIIACNSSLSQSIQPSVIVSSAGTLNTPSLSTTFTLGEITIPEGPITDGLLTIEADSIGAISNLVDFILNKLPNGNLLKWKVNDATTSIVRFRILKNRSGSGFEEIGQINKPLNIENIPFFSFVDREPLMPSSYRIEMTENNGRTVSSAILSTSAVLTVSPNPVKTSKLFLGLNGFMAGRYEVAIVNAAGVCMMKTKIWQQARSQTHPIDLPLALPSGAYSVSVASSGTRHSIHFLK